MDKLTSKEVAYKMAPCLPMPDGRAPIFTSIIEAHGHFEFKLRYPNGQRFEIVVRELVADQVRPDEG